MCADMIEVHWEDKEAQKALALLEDISPSGACLQFERPVPLGAQVHWESPKQGFAGTVRYCIYREIGYFVGVEFRGACRWSKKAFQPRHLFDPERMVAKMKKKAADSPTG